MLSIVVLISGSGSNLRAILEATDNPLFPAKVLAVGADCPAEGLAHAEEFSVPTFVVEPKFFASKQEWAKALVRSTDYLKPDLVVLAGFMRILPESFVNEFAGRIINLHPSLLPVFPGAHAVADALAAGATETGSTVHVVDAGVDTGPVISQKKIAIRPDSTVESLTEEIKSVEHNHIVEVIRKIAESDIQLSKVSS
jgi:phosphoribosylglycinamide formyltransferase-1